MLKNCGFSTVAFAHPCSLLLLLPILLHRDLAPNCSSPALLMRSKLPNNQHSTTEQIPCLLKTILNQVFQKLAELLPAPSYYLIKHSTSFSKLKCSFRVSSKLAFSNKDLSKGCSGLFTSIFVFSVGSFYQIHGLKLAHVQYHCNAS